MDKQIVHTLLKADILIIYLRKQQYYIVTTKHDEIKSVYATGEKAQTESLKINENASHIFEKLVLILTPLLK